jgi:L-fuculose-phosphate aldolase
MSKKARAKEEHQLRTGIVAACRRMNALGINQGTSGNISARFGERLLITPSGVPYDDMAADDIAALPIEGE